MVKLIDFESYPVKATIKILLTDKATNKNIVWATSSYKDLGYEYSENSPIEISAISGINQWIVIPRVEKDKAQQQKRTRNKAEVFTPSWICNKMNNICDNEWFGRANVFNTEIENKWISTKEKIEFSSSKTWQKYVDLRKLEITCGEAPYICSRYDMATGEKISLDNRIGMLDRKIRVINENTTNKKDWIDWVIRAFQSTYGYELQGDNLIIARINLLLTFYEYYFYMWQEEPTKTLLRKIANIISWNIWQMDGLKGTVPNKNPNKLNEQLSFSNFFDEQENIAIATECKLHNWRTWRSLSYSELKGVKSKMQFDFVIGNPPYQESTGGNGRQAKPVYNVFIEEVKTISNKSLCLIIPARWFSGGMGLDNFRSTMLSDNHIKSIIDYPNSDDLFKNVDVAGGLCIFIRDLQYKGECNVTNIIQGIGYSQVRPLNEYKTFVRFSQSVPIIRKVFEIEKPKHTMEETVSPQKPFGLPTNYTPKDKGIPCQFIQKIGKKYADEIDVKDTNDLLNKWKLIVPRSPIAGQTDFTKPVGFYYNGNSFILKPGECCTESFIVAGAFETESEVKCFKSYLFTKIVRFLLLQAVVSQDVLRNKYCFVPALKKYDTIYTDEMLCKRWNITDEEYSYISSKIHNYSK